MYLIVDLPEGGRHLVGERAGHNDDVSLTRRRAEHDPVPALKGLSHEVGLAFDDNYGKFQAKIGDAASFRFFKCSNDFIMQKVYLSRLKGLSHEMDLAFDDKYGQF